MLDATGAAIAGAQVSVVPDSPGQPASAVTNVQGEFEIPVGAGDYTIRVSAPGFLEGSRRLTLKDGATATSDFALAVAGVQESVSVGANIGYSVPAVSSATRTTTPLRDVPQAISVVSRALIADQRMASMADVTRYMPGVGFAQGEGNRDTPILRGNSSTSDFFIDGVRDDVQYFRDVYNVDRVEALKGPNAMIFGRGGVGGVINRVTRQADWGQSREASVQFGSWDNRRFTADVGRGLNQTVALRATALYENSDSYRNGAGVDRVGINPTVAVRLGPNTTVRAGYEYFHDERVGDRGISSFNGRPVETDAGDVLRRPVAQSVRCDGQSHVRTARASFRSHITLRNRVSYGDYDKFYQNVFPGAVNPPARRLPSPPTTTRPLARTCSTRPISLSERRPGGSATRCSWEPSSAARIRRTSADGILLHSREQRDDVQCPVERADDLGPGRIPSERDRRGQPRRHHDCGGIRAGSDRPFETR